MPTIDNASYGRSLLDALINARIIEHRVSLIHATVARRFWAEYLQPTLARTYRKDWATRTLVNFRSSEKHDQVNGTGRWAVYFRTDHPFTTVADGERLEMCIPGITARAISSGWVTGTSSWLTRKTLILNTDLYPIPDQSDDLGQWMEHTRFAAAEPLEQLDIMLRLRRGVSYVRDTERKAAANLFKWSVNTHGSGSFPGHWTSTPVLSKCKISSQHRQTLAAAVGGKSEFAKFFCEGPTLANVQPWHRYLVSVLGPQAELFDMPVSGLNSLNELRKISSPGFFLIAVAPTDANRAGMITWNDDEFERVSDTTVPLDSAVQCQPLR